MARPVRLRQLTSFRGGKHVSVQFVGPKPCRLSRPCASIIHGGLPGDIGFLTVEIGRTLGDGHPLPSRYAAREVLRLGQRPRDSTLARLRLRSAYAMSRSANHVFRA